MISLLPIFIFIINQSNLDYYIVSKLFSRLKMPMIKKLKRKNSKKQLMLQSNQLLLPQFKLQLKPQLNHKLMFLKLQVRHQPLRFNQESALPQVWEALINQLELLKPIDLFE